MREQLNQSDDFTIQASDIASKINSLNWNDDNDRKLIIGLQRDLYLLLINYTENLESDSERLEYFKTQLHLIELAVQLKTPENLLHKDAVDRLGHHYPLHAMIESHIKHIESRIDGTPPEPKDELLFIDWIEKIVLMEELGVIEFLRKKIGQHTPGRLHKLIFQMAGIPTSTVKKSLERIADREKYKEHYKKAKIFIGEVKNTDDVLK